MIAVTWKKITLGVLVAVLLVGMYSGWLDEPAKEYTEQGLKRVLITYAVARGLNGLISVAQGTEISVEPVGVGMTFTPGQILDPVNDLIEQFSWLVHDNRHRFYRVGEHHAHCGGDCLQLAKNATGC